jgi:signal transduction histidine kinase
MNPASLPPALQAAARQQPPRTAEEKSALEMQLMSALLLHAKDVFCCYDVQGGALRASYVSPSVRNVLGWASEALAGRDWCELAHPDDAAQLRDAAAAVMAGGSPSYVLYRARTAEAGSQYTWVYAHLCRDDAGRLLSVARSAAGHKKREEALHGFLLVTSHDLRTPCHGCAVAAQLLHARDSVAGDAEASSLVDAVSASCGLMLSVLTNVLAVKDIQAGGVAEKARRKLPLVRYEPRALLASALQTCRLGCGVAPGRIIWRDEASAALLAAVEGDAERVTHIVQNVLVYALQAGSGAPLEVRLTHGCTSGVLRLDVCDCGRELRPEEREGIFSLTDGCACLGLYVARFFARAVGGDLTAEADDCGGTTLRLRLPARIAPPPPVAPESPPAFLGKRAAMRADPPSVAAQRRSCASRPLLQENGGGAISLPQPPPLAQAAVAPPARPRCLFIDDHVLNLKLVRKLLEKHGFEA